MTVLLLKTATLDTTPLVDTIGNLLEKYHDIAIGLRLRVTGKAATPLEEVFRDHAQHFWRLHGLGFRTTMRKQFRSWYDGNENDSRCAGYLKQELSQKQPLKRVLDDMRKQFEYRQAEQRRIANGELPEELQRRARSKW